MRLRDQPTVEVETRIAVPAAVAWAAVTDPDLSARYSPELQEVTWLDGATGVAPGVRFKGRNRNDDMGEWETTARVVEFEPPLRWVWAIDGGEEPGATWGFEVDPSADGTACTVRHWGRIGLGFSGLTMVMEQMPGKEARIVAHRLGIWREAMTKTLAGLKAELEASNL